LPELECPTAQAAVIISSFTAAWVGDDVVVEWETASELDTADFYVQRSDSQNGIYIRITELITAEGDDISGASYQYLMLNAISGNTYWYKLETIDLNQESEYLPTRICDTNHHYTNVHIHS